VPLADEVQRDGFGDQGAAIGVDGNRVLKVRDTPGLRGSRKSKGKDGGEEEYERCLKRATTGAKARILS
jgi:hypothetical protein